MSDVYVKRMLRYAPKSLEDALILFDEIGRSIEKSSPHIVNDTWVRTNLCWSKNRTELFNELINFVHKLRNIDVYVDAVMLGGSFVSRKDNPRDIDALIIYHVGSKFSANDLSNYMREKSKELHLRVAPSDAGLMPLIKSVIYNHTLFQDRSRDKGSIILNFFDEIHDL